MNTRWDDTFEQLLRPLLPLLPDDRPIGPELDLVAAGLDSLNVVELLAVLEDHYGFAFADHEIAQQTVATPATLWTVVSAHLSQDARP